MRLTVALLALLLLLPAVAQSPGLDVTFHAPAELQGTADADAAWVALVLAPGDTADATVSFGAGTVLTNHTHIHTTIHDPLTGTTLVDDRALPPERHRLADATELRVGAPSAWTAVLLTGDLRLTVDGGGVLAWGDRGGAWAQVSGPRDHPVTVARPEASVLPLTGGYLAAAGNVTVAGRLDAMEWHALSLSCRGDAAPCAPDPSPSTGPATTLTYHDLEGDGALAWNGTAHGVLVGRGSLAVLLDGTLRLPLARSDGDCPGCVGWQDRTLTLEGLVRIQDLRRAGTDRLHATLSGDVQAAHLDESPEPVGRLGLRGAAVVGVAVVGLGVGALGLLALRVAMAPERALQNDSRRTIHDAIEQQPGISFRDVQRSTGLGNGNIVYHLGVLEAAGVVRRRSHQNQVHYFLPRHFDGDAWRAEVSLAKPELRRLHGLVTVLNTPTQGEVVAATEPWGWSRAVTQKRLRKLEEVRLVRVITSGRFRHYAAVPHQGVPSDVPGSSSQPATAAQA